MSRSVLKKTNCLSERKKKKDKGILVIKSYKMVLLYITIITPKEDKKETLIIIIMVYIWHEVVYNSGNVKPNIKPENVLVT